MDRHPRWQYGLITVPARRHTLLPRTLASLAQAGFPQPWLFVDGGRRGDYTDLALPLTMRDPPVRTYGNWILGLWELYLRDPAATHFAMFQDDLIASQNLRSYLEKTTCPASGYRNLYTFPQNEAMNRNRISSGWYLSNQRGLGGLALVFDRGTVIDLLTTRHVAERVQDPHRGWQAMDGAVVTAMKNVGRKEYVHTPSLVQHTGDESTMRHHRFPAAPSFRGETFDLLSLLPQEPIHG